MLNRHGIFFELGPGTYPVQHALCHEPWWIFNEDGDLSSEGLLRPRRENCGVYQLAFQTAAAEPVSMLDAPLPSIPDGFYAGRQFVFPAMEQPRHSAAASRVSWNPLYQGSFIAMPASLLNEPRAWIRIPMPPGIPALHHAVNGIVLHAVTVSNVFARIRPSSSRATASPSPPPGAAARPSCWSLRSPS